MAYSSTRSAFTLVELSIVLVIIGLIIGGIIASTSILKRTEMQTVLNDYSNYSTAVAQFRQQYGGYPGDIHDATSFWGDDSTICADGNVTNGSPGTCNGDSNGDMSDFAASGCRFADGTTTARCEEPYRAWQHLVLGEFIKGYYTGTTPTTGTNGVVLGTNVPKSHIDQAGWSFGYKADTTSAPVADQYNQGLSNFLAFGAVVAASAQTQGAALTPTDAWNVDKKIDDGKPGTGRVVTMKPAFQTNTCADSATDATAIYNVSDTSTQCSLNMSLTLK